MDSLYHPEFLLLDAARRAQGETLQRLGFGPVESAYAVRTAGPGWRLRDFGDGDRGSLLVVGAPIKRPYIWDLEPAISVVRFCRDAGFGVRLLEWTSPAPGGRPFGLDDYVEAIGEAVAALDDAAPAPVLLGHSLGGTLAAIYAAYAPGRLAGVALIGAPVCFAAGASRFRDAVMRLAAPAPGADELVPGSILSQGSALVAPAAFVWSRIADRVAGASDPQARAVQLRVERWALDEVALPGLFMRQVLGWLYREDRLQGACLPVKGRALGPGDLAAPILGVANLADEVAPPAAIAPFVAAGPARSQILDYPGEVGVGLQHVALLVGRRARAEVWPRVLDWVDQVLAGRG